MSKPSLARSGALLSILAGLASSAQAQFVDVRYQGDTTWDGTFEAPEDPGVFLRYQAGDFDRDSSKDVFVLANGQLVFFYSPATWDALRIEDALSTTVNDIAAIPAQDAPSSAYGALGDALVYVDIDGLFCVYPVTNGGFTKTTLANSASPWANALRLRTGDVDANGDVDCIGIKYESNPSQTILVRRTQAGVGHTNSFSVSAVAYDLQVLQWDSDAQLEIAVLTSVGVKVYDYNGTLLNTFANHTSTTTDTDAIAVFHKQSESNDRLAWARRKAAPNTTDQELVELTSASTQPIASGISFPATDRATAMVAADVPTVTGTAGVYELDGKPELMVAHEAHQNPNLIRGIAGSAGESFSSNSADQQYLVDPDVGGLNEPMWIGGYTGMPAPIFEDLTGDGLADIFLPVQNEEASWFQVWRGEPIQLHTLFGDPVTALELGLCAVPSGGGVSYTQTQAPNATGEMTVELNLPYSTQPVVPNKLEVIVWRRKVGFLTSGQAYFPYARVLFPLLTDSDSDSYFDDPWSGTGILRPKIPINFLLTPSSTTYLPCQDDGASTSPVNFWFSIRLAYYVNNYPAENTLRKVGEEYVVAFAASAAEGLNLNQDDPDYDQVCVTNFPDCGTPTIGPCPTNGLVLSGSNSHRRRLPPSSNKLPPNPPSSVIVF